MQTAGHPARLRPNRWWVVGYLATACLLSVLLFTAVATSSGRTGLNRWVFPHVGFAGPPVPGRCQPPDHARLPGRRPRAAATVLQRALARVLARSGGRHDHPSWRGRRSARRLAGRRADAPPHAAGRDACRHSRGSRWKRAHMRSWWRYQQHGGASALRLQWQPRGAAPPRVFRLISSFPGRPALKTCAGRAALRGSHVIVAAVWALPLLFVPLLLAGTWPAILARTGKDSSLGKRCRTGSSGRPRAGGARGRIGCGHGSAAGMEPPVPVVRRPRLRGEQSGPPTCGI